MRHKKGGHGGKRPGSGRKGPGTVPYSVRITREQAELLRTWGGGDVSAGLRWLIGVAEPMVHKRVYDVQQIKLVYDEDGRTRG